MHINGRSSLVRRVLLAATAIALLTPPPAVSASDPLAAAVARLTAAERAENHATARYDAATARYYGLLDQQASSERSIVGLTVLRDRLVSLGRRHALIAYKRGALVVGDVLGDGSDVLDAARRATMLDAVNAQGQVLLSHLDSVTSELHDRQSTLRGEISRAESALSGMQSEARDAERALADAGRAERDLRARLASERRLQDLSAVLAAARGRAALRSASTEAPSGGSAGRVLVHGTWVCPVQGPMSFTDTYGSPRSGGRRHLGNDLFAPSGTPLVAVTDGTVFFQADPLGGNAAYVQGRDGNTYYYAHLTDYVGGARSVRAGELIGHVGKTGDASDAPPQLHFEIRPGGPNSRGIDPYSTLAAHCG